VLLPVEEDLPPIARPFNEEEKSKAQELGRLMGFEAETDLLPIQVIGTGVGLNEALDTAFKRMSDLTGMSVSEVRNRTTIAGSVDIARASGVVQLTMLVPTAILDKIGIGDLAREMYLH
jgi:formamidase